MSIGSIRPDGIRFVAVVMTLAVLGLVLGTGVVRADGEEKVPEKQKWQAPFGGTLSAAFTVVSDYTFGGISQTNRQPAFQPSVAYRTPSLVDGTNLWLYLGAWGASWVALTFTGMPMAVMLLRSAEPRLRGRVMGVRMLAVYGMPLGLLLAGWMIHRFGFAAAATAYCLFGLLATGAIALFWRRHLFPLTAPANAR